jgi:hypothetical protein
MGATTQHVPVHETFYARLKAKRVPSLGLLALNLRPFVSTDSKLVFGLPPFRLVQIYLHGNHVH